MRSLTLRTLAVTLIMATMSFGLFAWHWPASWRLPVRPRGTISQPQDRTAASDDLAPAAASGAWMALIAVMAILLAIWLLVVLL